MTRAAIVPRAFAAPNLARPYPCVQCVSHIAALAVRKVIRPSAM
jgi:hypothetical protein